MTRSAISARPPAAVNRPADNRREPPTCASVRSTGPRAARRPAGRARGRRRARRRVLPTDRPRRPPRGDRRHFLPRCRPTSGPPVGRGELSNGQGAATGAVAARAQLLLAGPRLAAATGHGDRPAARGGGSGTPASDWQRDRSSVTARQDRSGVQMHRVPRCFKGGVADLWARTSLSLHERNMLRQGSVTTVTRARSSEPAAH